MARPSKLVLAALGIAVTFTFTLGASAGTLTAHDDEASATPPPSPSPSSISAPAAVAAFPETDVGALPPAQARTELDPVDPWTSKTFAIARAPKKSKPRPLDTADPWASSSELRPSALAAPPVEAPRATTPASTPSRASDDALREAIKRAVDAGDLDRAAKLLEILRTPR
jgi:hypothetical protein